MSAKPFNSLTTSCIGLSSRFKCTLVIEVLIPCYAMFLRFPTFVLFVLHFHLLCRFCADGVIFETFIDLHVVRCLSLPSNHLLRFLIRFGNIVSSAAALNTTEKSNQSSRLVQYSMQINILSRCCCFVRSYTSLF